jgi:hypothetical protein
MSDFIILLAIVILSMGLVFAGLSISVILKKNGRFPVTSIGRNKEMKKRGITCVRHDEMICHGKGKGSCC